MRAIILAAGMGTRLHPYTINKPKCMVKVEGKPIIEHQLETLRGHGIHDINIVLGHFAESVPHYDLKKYFNPDFVTTNMVSSLFCAQEALDGNHDLIIAYGDIVYESAVMGALLACNAPIGIVVDLSWRHYWEARMQDPLADAETLRIDGINRVVEIGKKPSSFSQIDGQYIGLIKIRNDCVAKLKNIWYQMDRSMLYDGFDFHRMYFTSFLQYLIDSGWLIEAVSVENGWAEIDVPSDISVARQFWQPVSMHI